MGFQPLGGVTPSWACWPGGAATSTTSTLCPSEEQAKRPAQPRVPSAQSHSRADFPCNSPGTAIATLLCQARCGLASYLLLSTKPAQPAALTWNTACEREEVALASVGCCVRFLLPLANISRSCSADLGWRRTQRGRDQQAGRPLRRHRDSLTSSNGNGSDERQHTALRGSLQLGVMFAARSCTESTAPAFPVFVSRIGLAAAPLRSRAHLLHPPDGRRGPGPRLLSLGPPGSPRGPWAPAGRESARCTPRGGSPQ